MLFSCARIKCFKMPSEVLASRQAFKGIDASAIKTTMGNCVKKILKGGTYLNVGHRVVFVVGKFHTSKVIH